MIESPSVRDDSLVYMYGISDFWVDIFADTELVESILSATTISMGEVYSYFLQRAAGISLEEVGERYNSRIRLLLLDSADALDDRGTTFPIDSTITGSSKISNRPILPTDTLADNIHYEMVNNTIRFHRPISELAFPSRTTSTGSVQYSMWMVDAEINESWISRSFGALVNFTEEDAIFNYKSFLEGVYYLYTNGPNISFIERGVNLAMGMPYARSTETVLDISQDAVTGNYVVFTNTQSYEIPYGFQPELAVGQDLQENEVLTTWVEIRDFTRNGEWWYDVFLPNEVLGPGITSSSVGRCVQGSTGDMMMQNFLRHHVFEVLVTQPDGDRSSFDTASRLVLFAKPEYTYPVFIWKAPLTDEPIELECDFSYNLQADLTDTLISAPAIADMDRGDIDTEFVRGTQWYNRVQGSEDAVSRLGYGVWEDNGGWAPEFDALTAEQLSRMNVTMRTRGDAVSPITRNTIIRGWRGYVENTDDEGNALDDSVPGITWRVEGSDTYPNRPQTPFTFNERDLTPLYVLTQVELEEKIATVSDRWYIFPDNNRFILDGLNLVDAYDTWMVRNSAVAAQVDEDVKFNFIDTDGGLHISFSKFMNQSYAPKRSDMLDSEGNPITNGTIFISRINSSTWAIQWLHRREDISPTLLPVRDPDAIDVVESYDFSDLGNVYDIVDSYIAAGAVSIVAPRRIGFEVFPYVFINNRFVSTGEYTVSDDDMTLTFSSVSQSTGYIYWAPFLKDPEVIPAGGTTYTLSEAISDRENTVLSYEGEVIVDYTLDPDGVTLTLGTALPSTSALIVNFIDHSQPSVGDPISATEETVTASGTTYTIRTGYSAKIFMNGRILRSTEYLISGSTLTFHVAPTEDFRIRYYPRLTYTLQSSFNRSTVARNRARFLMDRSRPDGAYDDFWDDTDDSGTPTVYLNRGGAAWLTPPTDTTGPVDAENLYITRSV